MTDRKQTTDLNVRLGKATRVFRKNRPLAPPQSDSELIESVKLIAETETLDVPDAIDESLEETQEVLPPPVRSRGSRKLTDSQGSRRKSAARKKSKVVRVECSNCGTRWQFRVRRETKMDCEECGEVIVVSAENQSAFSKLVSKLTGG